MITLIKFKVGATGVDGLKTGTETRYMEVVKTKKKFLKKKKNQWAEPL